MTKVQVLKTIGLLMLVGMSWYFAISMAVR